MCTTSTSPTDVVVVVTLIWVVQWILRAALLFQIRVTCHGAAHGGLCCMGELLKTVILLLEEVI